MNEVKKCSISGISFTFEIDAFSALENYLKTLTQTYEGNEEGREIIADIEAHIVELILSKQDNKKVVTKYIIESIISQIGSADAISDSVADDNTNKSTPRIPRRLYRDMSSAKLGGICSGLGKYFDLDPVWVRLGLFSPLILSILFSMAGGLVQSLFMNIFGVFILSYIIMWFAVPIARSARQRLEMNGEKITEEAIKVASVSNNDADTKARPIVAEVISVFGQIILVFMKIILGVVIAGLILFSGSLIIGLIAIIIAGGAIFSLGASTIWIPLFGILMILIPSIILIYLFINIIANKNSNKKIVVTLFVLWLASIVACCTIAIAESNENGNGGLANMIYRNPLSKIYINPQTELERILNNNATSTTTFLNSDFDLVEISNSVEQDSLGLKYNETNSIKFKVNDEVVTITTKNIINNKP